MWARWTASSLSPTSAFSRLAELNASGASSCNVSPLEAIMDHSWQQIGNTCPFNVTHHPAISVPCGLGEGERPIGLMLIGKHWQESTLYRVADAFERACNWQTVGIKRR